MHLNDPIDQNAPHFLVDVDLLAHVAGGVQFVLVLSLLHVSLDCVQVL